MRSWGRERTENDWGAIREFDLWSVEAIVAAERITAEVTVGRLLIADSNVFSHVIVESFPPIGVSSEWARSGRFTPRPFCAIERPSIINQEDNSIVCPHKCRPIGELVQTKETFHQFNGSLAFATEKWPAGATNLSRSGREVATVFRSSSSRDPITTQSLRSEKFSNGWHYYCSELFLIVFFVRFMFFLGKRRERSKRQTRVDFVFLDL